MVDIQAIRKSFHGLEVLRGIDLQIPPGTVTVIIGPSGSGKSTLLRTINSLEKPDSGLVFVDGELIGAQVIGGVLRERSEREVLAQRSHIGFVFQNFNLFAHMTVLDNVAYAPIAVQGRRRREVEPLAVELLKRVGVADKAHEYPRRLSGGQQQRVAIARAMALRPKLLLLDEPTSALDPELVGEVLDVMVDLAHSGTTMVVVTHEIGFARQIADRVIFVDEGRIVESGPAAQVLDSPRHERTKAFISRVL